MVGLRLAAVQYFGHGIHAVDLPQETVIKFNKSFIVVQMLYFADVVTTKAAFVGKIAIPTAFLFLYYRIFGVMFGSGARYISLRSYLSRSSLLARPSPWPDVIPYRTTGINISLGNGIANIILNFVIFCLPVPMTLRLNTTVRQKLIISSIFILGFFVYVVSNIRIIAFSGSNPKDMTWSTVPTATWSSIEQAVSIICTCLPTLRPLFTSFYGSTSSNSKKRK
ncbi:conserved hypothetical protein [Talaromyces stipitatus ATCC 10500]|uniref:Rhodopsin domain-containing protein n=1 Tax=Talaromyces stipitatus (strain ATCC 10500 / CBS 375.48 / QM 6759 / NRRL 1006) TaxID=441959 RepID=B8MJ58_TALSN|nr:uncharacterized protein TSTA_051570 [Talaromyces stipitatus ATCC 10500]EED15720.1 conserved hypothetical protein [Talaromyces stipitatus ATCC 10500]